MVKSYVFKREQYWKTTFKGVKTEAKTKTSYSILFFSLGAPVKRNKLYSCTPQGKGKSLLIVLQGKGRSLLICREREVIFKLLKLLLWPIFFPFPLHLWPKFFLFPAKPWVNMFPFSCWSMIKEYNIFSNIHNIFNV